MSVKAKLRAAILSGGATGASPSGEAVSINCKGTVGEWEAISTFVAPANGYVQIQGKSTDVGGMAALTSTSGYAGMNWAAMGLHLGFSLPVKKGETVTCRGARLTNIIVQMLKLVGGGETPTLAGVFTCGGGLCVRIFSALCSRRFEGAIRVFLRSFPLTATQPSLQGISTPTKTRSSPQQTDSYPFSSSHPRLRFAFVTPKSSTGRGVNHPVALFGLLRSCLAGKARHTITTRKARTLQPFAICASTQTRANSALLTGGF